MAYASTCRRCEGPLCISGPGALPLRQVLQTSKYSSDLFSQSTFPINKMSTSHILPLPIPVVALRGLQLLVAIVILGLSAWGLSAISFDAASLALFTAIITLIITSYNVVSFFALKDVYNYVSTQFDFYCPKMSRFFTFRWCGAPVSNTFHSGLLSVLISLPSYFGSPRWVWWPPGFPLFTICTTITPAVIMGIASKGISFPVLCTPPITISTLWKLLQDWLVLKCKLNHGPSRSSTLFLLDDKC